MPVFQHDEPGVIDTSVIVDIDVIDERASAVESSIATITLAELSPGGRAVHDLIAATALFRGLPLSTRNPCNFASLAGLLPIIAS